MRKSLILISFIFVICQVVVAKPLGSVDNKVDDATSSYGHTAEKYLLSTEHVVLDLYDKLPEMKSTFDTYLTMLADYKENSTKTSSLTQEMFVHWFQLLGLIKSNDDKPIDVEVITKAISKDVKSAALKNVAPMTPLTLIFQELMAEEAKEQQNRLRIKFLNLQLNELLKNKQMTDAEKSIALLSNMAEWDESFNKEAFTKDLNILKENFTEESSSSSPPGLIAEYISLREYFMEMLKENPSHDTLLMLHTLGGYLNAFKVHNIKDKKAGEDTVTKDRINSFIPKYFENEKPLSKSSATITDKQLEDNALKSIYNQLIKNSADHLTKNLKIKYMSKQLEELKYNLHLTDSQKSLVILLTMVEWDESHDKESFNSEVENVFKGLYLEDSVKPKILVEYLRLRKLQTEMLNSELDTILKANQLGIYLKSFNTDFTLMPKDFDGKSFSQRMQSFDFWKQCLVSTCSEDTFWKLLN